MTVSVLVPWRGGDPDRERAWQWAQRWWASQHPGWQVVTGSCGDGPWCKAAAVADALKRANGTVIVVADADVFCDGLGAAVEAVEQGAPWAIPHHKVHRLTRTATGRVVAGTPPELILGGLERKPYKGVEGGGVVVLRRETYLRVPLDPRFADWGQEDESWGLALNTLAGRRWRGAAPLWHLHHPLAPRLNRHVGNASGWALHVRYQYAAKAGPNAMRQLIDEFATTVGAP